MSGVRSGALRFAQVGPTVGPTAILARMAGPFLQAAFFCERVLQEADGVVSAIRIVDQQTQFVAGPEVPNEMPPVVLSTTVLIALKAGDARGRYGVRIAPEAPSGQQLPALNVPVNFLGGSGEQGIHIVLPLQMQLVEEGLYWFDVLWVDDRAEESELLLTRMPLRVVYQPQPTP